MESSLFESNEKWYTSKEMCEICKVKSSVLTAFNKVCKTTIKRVGQSHAYSYSESQLKEFQQWLQDNKSEDAIVAKEDAPEAKWYTSKAMCEICNVDERTLKRFNECLTSEIDVPSQFIRKGGYHNSQNLYSEDGLKAFQAWLLKNQANQGRSSEVVKENASSLIKNSLVAQELINSGNVDAVQEYCSMIMETTQTINNQNQKLLEQQPIVDAYNKVANTNKVLSMNETAKLLGYCGRNTLFEKLRESKILQLDNVPYQRYIDRGFFEVKEIYIPALDNVKCTTYVTQKGIVYLNKLLNHIN